jgi:predicted  nucleic acid-binding Zn-ribbon protein
MPIFLLGLGLGLVIGHKASKASAQERIQALQKEIMRLHEVNRAREIEIARWRVRIQRLQQEIDGIRRQQDALSGFCTWVADGHPEIVARYRAIQQAEQAVVALRHEARADQARIGSAHEELASALQ